MQTTILIIILIMSLINLKLAIKLKDLEAKTINAFKVICKKLKKNVKEES